MSHTMALKVTILETWRLNLCLKKLFYLICNSTVRVIQPARYDMKWRRPWLMIGGQEGGKYGKELHEAVCCHSNSTLAHSMQTPTLKLVLRYGASNAHSTLASPLFFFLLFQQAITTGQAAFCLLSVTSTTSAAKKYLREPSLASWISFPQPDSHKRSWFPFENQ